MTAQRLRVGWVEMGADGVRHFKKPYAVVIRHGRYTLTIFRHPKKVWPRWHWWPEHRDLVLGFVHFGWMDR